MQEFLTNNTVSCNLMSLTGYRTLVILSALMESPKSNDEINDCLYNDQYVQERFSADTLRIYINNLRAIGCEITKANKSNNQKYVLVSHPFAYKIPLSQIKALNKLAKSLHDKIDIRDIIIIESFFRRLVTFISDVTTQNGLQGTFLLKNMNLDLIEELLLYCKNKNEITILYDSPRSGLKEIEIVADKLAFQSEKLYLWGDNLTHKEYSYFAVEKIKKVACIKCIKTKETIPTEKVTYELHNFEGYKLDENERVLRRNKDSLLIEATSKNEFDLMQKILFKANDCKIISPQKYKTKILKKLIAMEKNYE